MDKILVIVVTYNGLKWINLCLGSVLNSTVPLDILVVDNGSNDGTIDILKQKYPSVMLVQSTHNLGFGKANNVGLRMATEGNYDYVYLLNQDAWVKPDTIEKLILVHKKHTCFGILSPMQINASETVLDFNFSKNCLSACQSGLLSDFVFNKLETVYPVDFVMAAHWLISRECMLRVGGFSPLYSHYGEDDDYIHRLIYWGYKVGIVPSINAIHDREFRVVEPKNKIFHSFSSDYLPIISNINNGLIYSLFKGFLFVIRNIMPAMFNTTVWGVIMYQIKAIVIIPKAIRYRRKSKQVGAYLDIY